ncbi:MAG: hypothetical protein KIG35_01250, partial [Prevotellamassilia sp.]|nr:hypothetical protein [Prevotellamassilia sp.]
WGLGFEPQADHGQGCNFSLQPFFFEKTREILETMTRRDTVTAPSLNCHCTTKSRKMLRRSPFVAMRSSVVADLIFIPL